jgi:sugar phosphate isomerase/epimerase
MNRRQFVGATLAATAGVLNPGAGGFSGATTPKKKGQMKLGLYSITFLGIWYRGDPLALEEVIKRAKKYGYDGVELDGKRPHAHPLELSKNRCRELRRVADGEGIDIYGVAANNDFSSPVIEHREAQCLYVRDLVNCASELGAKTVRVFLAWPGVTKQAGLASYDTSRSLWETVHKGFSDEDIWAWCRDGLAECSRHAGEAGVTLALQNHKPVINTHHDVLRMVREVNSPCLKVSLDAPIMPEKTPEYIRQAALDVGPLQALSHFGGEYERNADGSIKGEDFYPPFVRAMHEIGYQGYIGYELCHPLPVVSGQTVGVEYAAKNAQLAAEFMRGLITSNMS